MSRRHLTENRDVAQLSKYITEDIGETTPAFSEAFNNRGRWYVLNPEDGSYWNGSFWSMDYRILTESCIMCFGDAKVISDSVDGIVCSESTINEIRGLLASLKNLPKNVAAQIRNWRRSYKVPHEPNSERYINSVKNIADIVDKVANKLGISVEEAFDVAVERVMGRGSTDITPEVKRAVTQVLGGKSPGLGKRGRAFSPARPTRL